MMACFQHWSALSYVTANVMMQHLIVTVGLLSVNVRLDSMEIVVQRIYAQLLDANMVFAPPHTSVVNCLLQPMHVSAMTAGLDHYVNTILVLLQARRALVTGHVLLRVIQKLNVFVMLVIQEKIAPKAVKTSVSTHILSAARLI